MILRAVIQTVSPECAAPGVCQTVCNPTNEKWWRTDPNHFLAERCKINASEALLGREIPEGRRCDSAQCDCNGPGRRKRVTPHGKLQAFPGPVCRVCASRAFEVQSLEIFSREDGG